MNQVLRFARTGMLAVAAASLLGSCKDEGGVLDVFFWAQGAGDCERLVVTVDMQSADALLAPPLEGRQECALYNLLENAGCSFEFETIDDGRLLRVIIDDCRIDDRSGLFRCAFSDGELEEIDLHTTAVCDCFGPSCDETPRLCVSSDSEDTTCETFESTTSTSSTSTSTSFGLSTEPTMSTTSTTGSPAEGQRYAATFGLGSGTGVGAIQFDIDYAGAAGATSRSARAVLSDPECTKLVSSASATFQYDDTQRVVHVSMTGLPGTAGPVDLVECTFEVNAEPVEGDFDVDVVGALDLEGDPIGTPPPVEVGKITLVELELTTTTVEDVTTTTYPIDPETYDVTFRLDSASDEVGALQWSTDYSSATGAFVGRGAAVDCESVLGPNVLFARNDKDVVCSLDQAKVCTTNGDCTGVGDCGTVLRELTVGLVAVNTFVAPIDVVRCTFNGTSSDPPVPSDFDVTLEDAVDGEGTPISVSFSVEVVPQ